MTHPVAMRSDIGAIDFDQAPLAAETAGRKCLCNGLMANVGHAQLRLDGPERALITSGNDLERMQEFLEDRDSFSAGDVIEYLTRGRSRGAHQSADHPDALTGLARA